MPSLLRAALSASSRCAGAGKSFGWEAILPRYLALLGDHAPALDDKHPSPLLGTVKVAIITRTGNRASS